MQVSIDISPKIVKLGEPVTVSYTSEGFRTTSIQLTNMDIPLTFTGDCSGSFKTLPIMTGDFTAIIEAIGRSNYPTDDGAMLEDQSTCQVK